MRDARGSGSVPELPVSATYHSEIIECGYECKCAENMPIAVQGAEPDAEIHAAESFYDWLSVEADNPNPNELNDSQDLPD